jgi:hypothetical protein
MHRHGGPLCHFVLEEALPLSGEQIKFYAFKLAREPTGVLQTVKPASSCSSAGSRTCKRSSLPDLLRSGEPNSLSDQTAGEGRRSRLGKKNANAHIFASISR